MGQPWSARTTLSTGIVAGHFTQQYLKTLGNDQYGYYSYFYEYVARNHNYGIGTIGLYRTHSRKSTRFKHGFQRFTYGAELHLGQQFIDGGIAYLPGGASYTVTNDELVSGGNVHGSYESRWFGFGMAIGVANVVYRDPYWWYEPPTDGQFHTAKMWIPLTIGSQWRFGPYDVLFLTIGQRNCPSIIHSYSNVHLGSGSGLGHSDRYSIRAGMSVDLYKGVTGGYAELKGPVTDKISVELFGSFVPDIMLQVGSDASYRYNVPTNRWYGGVKLHINLK